MGTLRGENAPEMLRCATYASPVGTLYLATEGAALVGLWMEGQRFFGAPYGVLPEPSAPVGVSAEVARWLDAYFGGSRPAPSELPLAPQGTSFRRRVWQELVRIPYGETVSYGELAARLGSSPRAVGGAVGRNPIALIIPCHRVLGADGGLGGYAGGAARKRYLLAHERGADVLLACAPALR